MRQHTRCLIPVMFVCSLFLLSACGGGSGGSDANSVADNNANKSPTSSDDASQTGSDTGVTSSASDADSHIDADDDASASPPDAQARSRDRIETDDADIAGEGDIAADDENVTPPSEAQLQLGMAAYSMGMCAKCHGESGTGGDRAPNLTDRRWLHGDGSIAGILAVLKAGVPREQIKGEGRRFAMNPATNLIKDNQALDALAAYVWSLSRR